MNAMQWVGLIRDIGLILGVPTLIAIGVKLYDRQIEVLKARNEFLKETQYDRAVSLLESQKKVFLLERETLETKIKDLDHSGSQKDESLAELQAQVSEVSDRINSLDRSQSLISEANFARSLFANDASFRQASFRNRVDFSEAAFDNTVYFHRVRFLDVSFDGADLRHGSFRDTDLRGVDLSHAVIDGATKLPKVRYGRIRS